jgi:hypothetical protein
MGRLPYKASMFEGSLLVGAYCRTVENARSPSFAG